MAKKRENKSARRRHARSKYIILDDITFGLAIHREVASVEADHGLTYLVCQESGKVRMLPPGHGLTWEDVGKEADILVRDITDEVILIGGEDDYFEENIAADSSLFIVESVDDLTAIFAEKKIQLFMQAVNTLSTLLAGCLLSYITWRLTNSEFIFAKYCYLGIPVGIAVAILFGLVPSWRIFRKLSANIVGDSKGNFINMKTGKTNLNGGFVLPMEGE